jgi:hypothetical protein
MKAISIRLEKDLYDWIVREAEKNGRPINSQVWITLEEGKKRVEWKEQKLREIEEKDSFKREDEESAISTTRRKSRRSSPSSRL